MLKIKIKHQAIPKGRMTAEHFREEVNQGGYKRYQMADFYQDSGIALVWIRDEVWNAVLAQVEDSLQEQPVDEKGGFLLGAYCATDEGQFEVLVDTYMRASEEFSSSDRLEFGVGSILILSEILDQNPDRCLIGWFHTHPGHTAYLSAVDLNIHEGFFRQPYQIAVVLDSLSVDYETAIFTRKPDGKVNNRIDALQFLYTPDIKP